MTLSTTANIKEYDGDNSTVGFSFPYLFYADGDLAVTVDGVSYTLNGGGATGFTVSGAGVGAGGTVTFNTAPANLAKIILQRIVSYTQDTDFADFDGNPADVTEKQFDLLTMQTQQIAEVSGRTILTPIGTALTSNSIAGTIDDTVRVLTVTTAGPATSTLASVSATIDTAFTSLTAGDFLQYDGSNWVNLSEVSSSQIADDAITTDKIIDDAVTTDKILDDAITVNKILDAAITEIREIPQNSQSVAYELVLSDGGKHILHPSADTTARIYTIPPNASVAFPIGTAITFINQDSAGVLTISITTDTMRLAGDGTTGSRTLAANGMATAVKVTATEWIISGTGLT